jgi:hypothetical protein
MLYAMRPTFMKSTADLNFQNSENHFSFIIVCSVLVALKLLVGIDIS